MRHFLLAALLLAAPAWAVSPPAVEGAAGMVVSSQHLASAAGVEMLRAGGNAVDAAVAVGYALAVTEPCCGNIGGGGFMTIHLADGRDVFLDFRETAPAAASRDMYLGADGNPVPGASLVGWKSVGVPGSVAGLEHARARFGKLSRAQVMAPAIKLARDGFLLTRGDTDVLDWRANEFRRRPDLARVFLRPDGGNLQPGDRLTQPALAATLQAIADGGSDVFYRGPIASALEAASRAGGGILTAADLAAYRVRETAPLSCTYRGHIVLSAPPPSSGGTALCQILNTIEGDDLAAMGWHSAKSVHLLVEAMRHAYVDRNTHLGDPDFVRNPLDRLLSKDYARAIRAKITDRATPSSSLGPGTEPHEKPETTHYSVLDRDGNAVAVTTTINGGFGALVMAEGFLLNDEMDDFTVKIGTANMFGLVQGAANAIAPGKRPLSSMAPTILLKDGRPRMVLGSPGGARIITITLLTLLNVVDYGMDAQEAVDAPRFHHQWLPDVILAEPRALSPDTVERLTAMGHKIAVQAPWGAANSILRGPSAAGPTGTGVDTRQTKTRAGLAYGARDSRRPAGSALAE